MVVTVLMVVVTPFANRAYGQSASTNQQSPQTQSTSSSPSAERSRTPQESLRALRQTIQQRPKDATLYYQAGLLEEQLGHWEQAIRDYQAAMRLNSSFVEAYYRAGRVTERLGETYYLGKSRVVKGTNLRYAISLYQAAIRIKPDFTDAYYYLSLASLMGGDLRQASEACQQVCRLEPDSERTRQLVQNIYDRYLSQTKKP